MIYIRAPKGIEKRRKQGRQTRRDTLYRFLVFVDCGVSCRPRTEAMQESLRWILEISKSLDLTN